MYDPQICKVLKDRTALAEEKLRLMEGSTHPSSLQLCSHDVTTTARAGWPPNTYLHIPGLPHPLPIRKQRWAGSPDFFLVQTTQRALSAPRGAAALLCQSCGQSCVQGDDDVTWHYGCPSWWWPQETTDGWEEMEGSWRKLQRRRKECRRRRALPEADKRELASPRSTCALGRCCSFLPGSWGCLEGHSRHLLTHDQTFLYCSMVNYRNI